MTLLVQGELSVASPYVCSAREDAERHALDEVGRVRWQAHSLQAEIRLIEVGETVYSLRRTLTGWCDPTDVGEFDFLVTGFGPSFVGRDRTPLGAYHNWEQKVHVAFQNLIRKRPFEMDAGEQRDWEILENAIDVAKYRRTTPISLRQIGCALYRRRQVPVAIRWANDMTERVSLERMPREFAALKPHQWFEAWVQRDPIDGSLVRVLSVAPLPTLRSLTDEQQAEYLRSLPVEGEGSS